MADEYILKSFDGGAQKTSLASAFTIGATTLSVVNGSTFPDGSAGPFVIVVDRGLASEEKFLIDTSSGVNGTTFNIQQAGYDGTSASAHSASAVVEHCLDGYTIEQSNRYVNLQTAKGDLVSHNGTTTIKLAVGANNTVLIADSTVSAGNKWATVGTSSLTDASVTAGKLASDSVETAKIVNLNVTTGKIADSAVTEVKLATDAVTTLKIADGSVTATKLAAGAIPSSVPVGIVAPFAGSAAPSGYVLCDGSAYSRTNATYAPLFAVIGTTYGTGDGSTTFNVPDLRNRMVAGKGTATWSDTLNEKGGSKDLIVVTHWHNMGHGHTATVSGTGTHNHNGRFLVTATGAGSNAHLARPTGYSYTDILQNTEDNTGGHSHTASVSNHSGDTSTVGSSGTDANLPPYITLNHIIKL